MSSFLQLLVKDVTRYGVMIWQSLYKKKGGKKVMKKETKVKQIVVRFDNPSYDKIGNCAENEHRGLGEFVRHAVLVYIEHFYKDDMFPKGD